MNNNKCLIIAEAGVNHNGSIEMAYHLCDAAKEAGADVIKFQTYVTENIITTSVKKARYQSKNTGADESQYDMLKKLELSYNQFKKIKEYCDYIGITFASTGDNPEDIDFLASIGIPFVKIGSGDIDNVPLLNAAGGKKLPIILSTGMGTLDDVKFAIRILKDAGANDITLLHCTTGYPCRFEDVNLNAMNTMKRVFGFPVGYSDHTVGSEVAISAVAQGAMVIEKHFTLDSTLEGPDHKASMEPKAFKSMVTAIRNVEKAMGDGIKVPTKQEQDISKVVKKRIVAKREIPRGTIIDERDICIKRAEYGLAARMWNKVIGSEAAKDYNIDEGICLKDKKKGENNG